MPVGVIRNRKAERELEALFESFNVDGGYFGGNEADGESIPAIAAKNENTRPFMSRAEKESEREIPKLFEREGKKSGFNAVKFAKLAGLTLVKLIKMQIDSSPSWAVPNSPRTIAIKGSSHPLVDTATMKNNTDYRVKK